MSKGFGIAALIIAILAVFVPFPFTVIASIVALIFAVISALGGDRIFATATPVIAGVNTFMLSPLTLVALAGEHHGGGSAVLMLVIGFLAAPFGAMVLNATGKLALKSKPSS